MMIYLRCYRKRVKVFDFHKKKFNFHNNTNGIRRQCMKQQKIKQTNKNNTLTRRKPIVNETL